VRILFALPLLATAAACNVDNDAANDQVRIEYNQERIEDAASDAARTTRDVASSIGNVASQTGRAISNEVGDIDVDVDVSRNRSGNAH
jgi:pyridoxine/pyridoxamine 5'-phosphate oxidase